MNCRICVYKQAKIGHLCKRCSYIKQHFKVDPREIMRLRAAQVDYCAICGKHSRLNNKRELAIDHDHETGEIRGLLCTSCNLGLGHLKTVQNLQSAITYLNSPRPVIPRVPVKHRVMDEDNYMLNQVLEDDSLHNMRQKARKLMFLLGQGMTEDGALSRLRRAKKARKEATPQISLDNQG